MQKVIISKGFRQSIKREIQGKEVVSFDYNKKGLLKSKTIQYFQYDEGEYEILRQIKFEFKYTFYKL